MSAERTCLPCQPPLVPLLTPRQDCVLHPRAHSPLLLSGLRGQADQENRSPVGPRALASRTPQRGLPFKPGRTLLAEGSHSMSLSLLKVPSCLLSCSHSHLQSLTCCHHASEAQEQVSCPREMPTGLGGTLRRPRPVLLQPQRSSDPPPPLLPLRVLSQTPLLPVIARSFREPWSLALLMQGLHVQHLMKVSRAPRRKVQVPPRKPLPLRGLAKMLWPGRPGYWWSSCWRSTPRSNPSCRAP